MLKRRSSKFPTHRRHMPLKKSPKALLTVLLLLLLCLALTTASKKFRDGSFDQHSGIISQQASLSRAAADTVGHGDGEDEEILVFDNADDADDEEPSRMGADWQAPLRASSSAEKVLPADAFWPISEAFPSQKSYADLVRYARSLPDIYHVTFEDAVQHDQLHGWEPDWIAAGEYDPASHGPLGEPRIDFVFTWVNGSDEAFLDTKAPYELNSTLNDASGDWLASHSSNRYRDWDELRYSVRSVEFYAPFRNRIQILVNSVISRTTGVVSKQIPTWLSTSSHVDSPVDVLSQEEFFESDKQGCLPTFNSLSIENQIHNTKSDVDILFAMSDDMLLGKLHAPSDIFSPLFGPTLGFKTNAYSTRTRPTQADALRFGEKPWLIYTSWLLNRRFGIRKRKGQAHFGHALSRRVSREAIASFPGPNVMSACSRFRGDFDFHLYSWYAIFHYTVERHREALLWSYIMLRSDPDRDGYLSPKERSQILTDLEEGMVNESKSSYRFRNFYHVADILRAAGLEPPKVNQDILWTSMDGPVMTKDIDCFSFDVNECLAPGFSILDDDEAADWSRQKKSQNPVYSTAAIFDRAARQQPECGDCLVKILLHRVHKGLSPLLPDRRTQKHDFDTVVKALIRYQYTVVDPDALFIMVTDAEQVESTLIKRFLSGGGKRVGQLCLNDDVATEDEGELKDVRAAMVDLYEGLFPRPSVFERAEQSEPHA